MHVKPGTAADELQVLWKVEDRGDEGERDEKEENRVC